jgi:5-methylcytosine-specific restriction endonuclease McrA
MPLHIDHIDGDSENHNESNLTLLCPNCHSLTSTYGKLNNGHGREKAKYRYVGI